MQFRIQNMTIQSFDWYNPTKLIVKHDASAEIVDYLVQDNITSVMLVYGRSSAKRIGVYDAVVNALKMKNIRIFELPNIRPNPQIERVIEGINICRQHNIQAMLPLGGGSCFDTAKGIAIGALFSHDVPAETIWNCYERTLVPKSALPIYGVMTCSGTGSEMNHASVMQDDKQKKKFAFGSSVIFPKVSIVDPKLQATIPWYVQVGGFVDAFMHVCENLTNVEDPEEVETTYAIDISLCRSIIKAGDKLLKDPNDHVARANFIWADICAIDQLSAIAMKGGDIGVHMLQHAMTAVNPNIQHGAGIGVAFLAFIKVNGERGLRKATYDRMAKEIFGREGWQGLYDGFKEVLVRWGHPTTLDELFGRKMTEEDRAELLRVFNMNSISCNHYPDRKLPEELAYEAYKLM
ncbi:Alcohol_dehydrogenase [Hexamita inflata]|uniref:Alcohol_dehydrogenase n=1 Tax=Hexamita inflata TaxID=28002 RepID=A0ABP1HLJ1_9EUKA